MKWRSEAMPCMNKDFQQECLEGNDNPLNATACSTTHSVNLHFIFRTRCVSKGKALKVILYGKEQCQAALHNWILCFLFV